MLSPEDKWKSETLDHVFNALALSSELSRRLIYKGARVLRLLLGEVIRASLDIDASFANITASSSVGEEDLQHLRTLVSTAVSSYFEDQDPVKFELETSQIRNRRASEHPWGWNVYLLDLVVRDLSGRGTPQPVRIEIASPELLSEHSTSSIDLNGHPIKAVTLERMAGEKLRAFLSSLPAYCNKLERGMNQKMRVHAPRAKDLHDLARILKKRPLADEEFWRVSGREFALACESRCIDCEGIATFREAWDNTKGAYSRDPTIPDDVSFAEAASSLKGIVAVLAEARLFPLMFELPGIVD